MDVIDLIKQGKIKRYFRATKKLNVPDMVFHVTQRAAGKEPLFVENNDYLIMLGLLKTISRQSSLKIYAFCLMPNHLHLLFSPTKENLYDAMRDLFSQYAIQFNRKYERKGHLFGGPYRQSVCLDDSYLLAASLYIHLNPIRAGLATNPINYRWSSCRLYGARTTPNSFVESGFILRLLSDDPDKAKEKYRFMLKEGSRLNVGDLLEEENILKRFRSRLIALFPSIFGAVGSNREMTGFLGINFLDEDELERKVEELKRDNLIGSPERRKAKKFLIEQLVARGYKRKEIAERFGISPKTIYNFLRTSPYKKL